MEQWRESAISGISGATSHTGGGGYFNTNEPGTPVPSNRAPARQQFLCPATIRQVLEAPEEGLKVGLLTTTMVSLLGISSDVEVTSTNIRFNLSDDTGTIDCLEWLETEAQAKPKQALSLVENTYYHVYGCIKTVQGRPRIMVFKIVPVQDFNEVTVFLLEVMNVRDYAEKAAKMSSQPRPTAMDFGNSNSFGSSMYEETRTLTPIQRTILDAIKAVPTQVGWSKFDPEIRSHFSAKQIQDTLDFLVGEGHIYTTVDDDHFCST